MDLCASPAESGGAGKWGQCMNRTFAPQGIRAVVGPTVLRPAVAEGDAHFRSRGLETLFAWHCRVRPGAEAPRLLPPRPWESVSPLVRARSSPNLRRGRGGLGGRPCQGEVSPSKLAQLWEGATGTGR